MKNEQETYDFVIIGSGFGGSVSALRLSKKGYKVLVIEKGKWFSKPEDFPKTTWNLKKYFWLPKMGLTGLLNLTFFRHVSVLSGVGVGGGSLVYANTLPVPNTPFFKTGSWKHLQNWEEELKPFYAIAKKMLGAVENPYQSKSDKVMHSLAKELGQIDGFSKTDVAIYFGKLGETVEDPYFEGQGPNRTGCVLCAGCMLGCRYNSKNTLDKNYLYLAQKYGAEIVAESEVYNVTPKGVDGVDGYLVEYKDALSHFPKKYRVEAKRIVFAGGVLGTLKLLLKLKSSSLPKLSDKLGHGVRTNSESLIGVTTLDKNTSFAKGIAIGSIIHLDENRHVEPVQYSAGSGFWRLLMAPMVRGKSAVIRIGNMVKDLLTDPIRNFRTFFVDDWSKRTHILLYMESIDSSLKMQLSRFGFLKSSVDQGVPPTSYNPLAQELAMKTEKLISGKSMVMASETILGIPTTAHILGGACMGSSAEEGVINHKNEVFNYKNMWICDGSMISANIGVNPSLTITAITERAMTFIPEKNQSSR